MRDAGIQLAPLLCPPDLPVQEATKFELLIDLKTAKALGIEAPISMQLLADEMIE
ncbi:MAG TPA: hypothetical protein VFP43_20890 [Mesorhizobium sp.]|nr:hypothetical protein [Mesorhizobium sp.]